MNAVQWIERDGHREYAIVPVDLFEKLVEAAEDLDDIAAYDAAKRNDDGFRIPGEIVHRELDGEHPVKLWRGHRGLTVESLAKQAGISKAYLSQIENHKRTGTAKTMKALAAALGIPLDAIVVEE